MICVRPSGNRVVRRTGWIFWPAFAFLCLALANASFAQASRTNPFPQTRKSIDLGRQIYLKHCVKCHDRKGKPIVPEDPGATRPADLTQPKDWVHGTRDHEMFDTLRDGTEEMPGFKDKLRDEDIWRVIHFLRSLWPKGSGSVR
jgi:mono/diheme cytochrome c family protein